MYSSLQRGMYSQLCRANRETFGMALDNILNRKTNRRIVTGVAVMNATDQDTP